MAGRVKQQLGMPREFFLHDQGQIENMRNLLIVYVNNVPLYTWPVFKLEQKKK